MSPRIDSRPSGAQRVHEAPPSIQRHVGVAAALQNQISVEHAAAQLAADQRLGVPGVRGTQQIQAGERRHELDGRGGAARSVAVLARQHAAGLRHRRPRSSRRSRGAVPLRWCRATGRRHRGSPPSAASGSGGRARASASASASAASAAARTTRGIAVGRPSARLLNRSTTRRHAPERQRRYSIKPRQQI